ncbi:hypothetical protein GBA52_013486 [Prunus armeniaca]|nr:hypothetical protein GBA52_013486 [Prunus armeniaca]
MNWQLWLVSKRAGTWFICSFRRPLHIIIQMAHSTMIFETGEMILIRRSKEMDGCDRHVNHEILCNNRTQVNCSSFWGFS